MISVLFVDDEPALLEITRLFLERSGEMTVETSRSALDALNKLKNKAYDAIVSDYEMPMMDGIVFLKILRAQGDQTPFIIFTGKGREHVVVEALNNRADFYLQKGQDPRSQFAALDGMIRQAIQRKSAEESIRHADRHMVEIINHLPDATFAIDMDGRVISWNKAMEDLTGVKEEDIIGKGDYEYALPFYGKRKPILIDLVLKPDPEINQSSYTNLRRQGNSLIAETENLIRGDTPAILWARATRIFDRNGTIIGAIESIRDITEIRRIEEERKRKEEREKEFGLVDRIFGKSTGAWYKKGVDLYYKQGRFQDAIACFDRVIEMDPGHVEAWQDRGICLKELGRYEEAIQSFDRVIDLNAPTTETFYYKGEALEKLGRSSGNAGLFEEAIRYFDKVLELDPSHINAWNYRGLCLKELRRNEEAKKSFDRAQTLIRQGIQRPYH
jgi:PAS domain S-box-containing protein